MLSAILLFTSASVQFSPQPCTPCSQGWTSSIGYSFVSNKSSDPMYNAQTQTLKSADGLSPNPTYPPHLNYTRNLVANRFVRGARLRHTELMTEYGYDFLELYHADGGMTQKSGLLDSQSAASTDAWWEVPGVGNTRLSRTPAVLRFRTDYNGQHQGFRFDQIQLCCSDTAEMAPLPVANMTDGVRYSGTLLAADDVVYFQAGAPTPGNVLHLNLWSMYSQPNFDIKVRCNALPTATTYDFVASTPFARWEYLPILGSVAQCTGVMYIAVYSAQSGGSFNLVASRAKASMMKTLRVGFEGVPTSSEWIDIDRSLVVGSRYYYGVTEGQHIVNRFDLFAGLGDGCPSCGGSKCDICFERDNRNTPSRVLNQCTSGARTYIIRADWDSPHLIAHELAHYLGCIPDEYCNEFNAPPGGCMPFEGCNWCDYSIVGGGVLNLCNSLNHQEVEANACTAGNIGASSMWDRMHNIYFIPISSPDAFDYENHHFNDRIYTW